MKKTLALLTAFTIFASFSAAAAPIYTTAEEKIMTAGVSLRSEQRFYGDYALNINCVTADLKNENLSFELLKHSGGSDKVDTVANLAKGEENTVAAINGDFFSAYKGNQNFSLGIEVKDGKLLQSHINADMAAGFFGENVLSLSYITFTGEVESPDGTKMPVAHVNKPTDYYGAVLMYTPEFNGGISPFLPVGITAVTVTDGVVSAKGTSLGGTIQIPENGYILVIDDNMTPFLEYKFNVGDSVGLSISVTPSLDGVDTAFGGGTLLLKDGKKTEITHNVSGNNPRSAIGTNADGTIIYMITVDGRQTVSRGVTLDALADICLEMGCVNAINLDGGGSTSMVGKTLENDTLHKLNSPSENRKVINALAVTSNAERGEAAGVLAEAEYGCVLSGDSVKLKLTPYDKNYNVPTVTNGKIEWVVSRGQGYVENNIYHAAGSGKTVLDVYYNGVKTDSCTINVLSEVCGITAPSAYSMEALESVSLAGKVKVFDKSGNTAVVNDISLLNPLYDSRFLSVSPDGTVKALKDSGGQLTLSHGGARRSIKITCGKYEADADKPKTADVMEKSASGGFEFAVYGASEVNTLFDRIVYAHAMDVLAAKDASAVIGGEMPADLTPAALPIIAPKQWSERNYDHAKVITLKLSSGILPRGQQWKDLAAALSDSAQKNIFIVSDNAAGFAAELDRAAFHSMLSEAAKTKNVFVIYSGDENFCRISDGIRYMTVADARDEDMIHKSIENTCYLSFNITDSGVTYQYKKLYE